MGPGITFWLVAWSMMGLAFVAAFTAIVVGAHSLDRRGGFVDSGDE